MERLRTKRVPDIFIQREGAAGCKPPPEGERGNAFRSRRGEIPARRESLEAERGGFVPEAKWNRERVSPSQTCGASAGAFLFS